MPALRLGIVTDTQDIWGTVLERMRRCHPGGTGEVLARFTGEHLQIPPMYSALRVDGKRLYDIARKGGEVERRARPITVHELKLLGREGEDWLLDIRCSKGTYVRTLCHDIGAALGCGGCMSALRRTGIGAFSVENAVTMAEAQRLRTGGSWKSCSCRLTASLPTARPARLRRTKRSGSAAGANTPPICPPESTGSTGRAENFSCWAVRKTAACGPSRIFSRYRHP